MILPTAIRPLGWRADAHQQRRVARPGGAVGAAPALRHQPARSGTCRPDWHPVRAAHRHRMGDAPQGDGVRLGGDLLAPIAGLAGGGRLGPIASRVAPAAARCRPHRLEQSLHRQLVGRGEKGGAATGPNPTDRGRPGTKRHLITDRRGIPLAFLLTGAHVHDSMPFEDLLDAVPRSRASAADHATGPTSCMPTRPTTLVVAAAPVTAAGSSPGSPAKASRPASGSATIDG